MSGYVHDEGFFDDENKPCIVVHRQPPIAVYTTVGGDVAVRTLVDDEEIVVTIPPAHVLNIVSAKLRQIELGRLLHRPAAPLGLPSPVNKDPTAAERMRRYRERHRNGRNDVTATLQFEVAE